MMFPRSDLQPISSGSGKVGCEQASHTGTVERRPGMLERLIRVSGASPGG